MVTNVPKTMSGVQLVGHGGLDKLEYRHDLYVPIPDVGEVLIKVGASAVNNTDINTRIGWYSKSVSTQTNNGGIEGFESVESSDASWSGAPLQFPRIQGADCCGEIVAVGEGVDPNRVGERVLVRSIQQLSESDITCITFGSECNGSFAQYTTALSSEAFTVRSTMTDSELASFPCSYSTAENMIERAKVKTGDTVFITGASGGVGSAAIQLVKRRGATVIAQCSSSKFDQIKQLGADEVISRNQSALVSLGEKSVDVVLDLVAGENWGDLLSILKVGGRYAVAGAIAGPMVELDVRTLYLNDLSFFGCTYQNRSVFENLIKYIEREEIKPIVSKEYPLSKITIAQEAFMRKNFVGKLVLLPQASSE
ncbi:alcohol dehydrogenase zinc-binding domain protein [Vibrio nigripulchritudo ATCC 27043]|uniref:alcohol dehydrogenase family protein n=1 Tax=Vibrio nigripulchritudo TaxID=28173 RepID=UPI00021C2A73|nr:alcohol dehydrogenase family protein [Vibrio nigripulchritudo]EGU56223.1 alcohol dehydrogenase zinc-binding domain protein [Vibrio nigripulchritudo ATCC 27043]